MKNILDLNGKTILITGASSGIGKATCLLLSILGANVILVARNEERLSRTLNLLEGTGHIPLVFDFNNVEDIDDWLKKQVKPLGELHGLVHCAGVRYIQPLKYLNYSNVEETIRINTIASLYLAKGFRQKGMYSSGSSIVLVSSIMGLVSNVGLSAYSASKGALISLTKSLALELATQKIRINCVAPAYVKSEMLETHKKMLNAEQINQIEASHPLGLGTPTDVSNSIVFLLSSMSSWITGTTLVIDGGYSAK